VFCVSVKVKLTVPLLCVCVHSAWKGYPENDLYCVGWDVKPCSLTWHEWLWWSGHLFVWMNLCALVIFVLKFADCKIVYCCWLLCCKVMRSSIWCARTHACVSWHAVDLLMAKLCLLNRTTMKKWSEICHVVSCYQYRINESYGADCCIFANFFSVFFYARLQLKRGVLLRAVNYIQCQLCEWIFDDYKKALNGKMWYVKGIFIEVVL